MKTIQKIGIGLTTFVVIIGLGGGVVNHKPYFIALYGLIFLLGQILIIKT